MDSVLRVCVMYLFLLVIFRLSDKRTLSDVTTFDMLLLLIISETVQQALIGDDPSMTHAMVLVVTFVAIDIVLSLVKQRSRTAEKWLEDVPLVLLADGVAFKSRMDKARVDEDDILEAARTLQGLESLDEIRLAVLERSGTISIVPKR